MYIIIIFFLCAYRNVCYKPGTRPFTIVVLFLFLLLCLFELRAHVDVTMVRDTTDNNTCHACSVA